MTKDTIFVVSNLRGARHKGYKMRPPIWQPPIELSPKESAVVKRIRKAKLFVFLRQIRHELFDSDFQLELAKIFKDSSVGLSPVPPAQLALFIILQAYTVLFR